MHSVKFVIFVDLPLVPHDYLGLVYLYLLSPSLFEGALTLLFACIKYSLSVVSFKHSSHVLLRAPPTQCQIHVPKLNLAFGVVKSLSSAILFPTLKYKWKIWHLIAIVWCLYFSLLIIILSFLNYLDTKSLFLLIPKLNDDDKR